jgi:hypothetical protein
VAVGVIFEVEGLTEAMYDQLRSRVHVANQPVEGQLYHAAGQGKNGWCIVEVWESQEAADRFFNDVIANAGLSPTPKYFQVHNVMSR